MILQRIITRRLQPYPGGPGPAGLRIGRPREPGSGGRGRRAATVPSDACTRHAGVGHAAGSMAPGRARATTHPPNPAPVIRAPSTPGREATCATRASRTGVDTAKSSARLRWLSDRRAPAPARSCPARASTVARTRAHSVTTWRALERRTGSRSAARSSLPATPEDPHHLGGRPALGHPGGVARRPQGAALPAVDDHDLGVVGEGDRPDGQGVEVDEQGVAGPSPGTDQRVHEADRDPDPVLGLLARAGRCPRGHRPPRTPRPGPRPGRRWRTGPIPPAGSTRWPACRRCRRHRGGPRPPPAGPRPARRPSQVRLGPQAHGDRLPSPAKADEVTTSVGRSGGGEGHRDSEIDGQGEGQALVVVGVVPDQIDPSGTHRSSGLGQRRRPPRAGWARAGRIRPLRQGTRLPGHCI